MALLHYLWSRVAASNASADANINWAEGQSPSSVNDSARAMMASAAGFRDDISGAIVTTGTSTAYAVTSYQIFNSLANMAGQMIAFTPHATNTGTVTLNVDGLGAKPLRSAPSVELPSGTLILGTPYVALYNNTDAAWYLHNFYVNPYQVPLAAGMDFWGSTTPNSAFAFPSGQAVSRATYATLFSLLGTTYGSGDGTTTFNLPDKTGRVSAMKEGAASRLTTTYFGAISGQNGAGLGSVGGLESNIIVTGNLPPYTPVGSVATTINGLGTIAGTGVGNTFTTTGATTAPLGTAAIAVSAAFTGTAQGGISTPVRSVQPTIICNYIIRVI